MGHGYHSVNLFLPAKHTVDNFLLVMCAIPVGLTTSLRIGKAKVGFEWASAILILALASFVAFHISMLPLIPAILPSDKAAKVQRLQIS